MIGLFAEYEPHIAVVGGIPPPLSAQCNIVRGKDASQTIDLSGTNMNGFGRIQNCDEQVFVLYEG